MKKKIIMVMLLTVIVFTLTAVELIEFNKDIYHSKSIIICFESSFVRDISGIVDFRHDDGIVYTESESFNKLSQEYRFVDLKQMHSSVRDRYWNENGIYIQNIYRVSLESDEKIEKARMALEKNKHVIFSEFESINRTLYEPNDPHYDFLWFIPKTETNLAWDYVQGSDEIIVAITDTGTKWNHEDLADNIWINEAELTNIVIDWDLGLILGGNGIDDSGSGKIDDVIGWDFVDNNNNPYQSFPGNQHGTHVAGCAGAVGDNNIGVTGTAMNVSLLICKGAPTNQPSSGVQYAYDQVIYSADAGAHIINCSWIGYGSQGTYANSVVNYATAQGALVVAGAGNSNIQHTDNYGGFPSDCVNSLSTAATDQNDFKANFSDYGEPIDISVPGVAIYSTYYNNSGNDSYQFTQGTSMSSPIAAGIAALVKTLHPDMPPLDLKARLMYTADYIDDLNPNYVGLLGSGRINAYRATMYDKIPHLSLYNTQIVEYEGDGDGVPNPGEVIDLIISLENDFYFITAFDVYAVISTDFPGVNIINDTSHFPNIGGGSIVFNSNNPFRFETDPYISTADIPFIVTVYANQDYEDFPYTKEIEVNVNLSLSQANWPKELPGATTSPALIEDLNNDGIQHVIFGDTQGNIHCLDASKTQAQGFPVNLGSNVSTGVAIGDINGNGHKEIIAARQSGFVHVLDYSGEQLFEYNTGGQIRANPILTELTPGGDLKIIILTFTNPRIIILNGDGSLFEEHSLSSSVFSSSAVADISGDGSTEAVFVTNDGMINVVNLVSGQTVPGFPVNINAASWHGPISGDFNGNGSYEIAVANVTGSVYLIDSSGNILFTKNTGNAIRTSVVASDINNNGSIDLTFADMQGNVYLLDTNGNDYPGFPVNVNTAIESTPVLADLTRNHQQEIIFGGNNGYLYALTLNGNFAGNFPYNIGGNLIVSPTIGDVDLDDDVDILIPNENSYHFIDYKRAAGSADWICFKGDSYRRGNFDLRTLPVEMEDNIVGITSLLGNYPNPFNPDTTIQFKLAEVSDASLKIYNLKGQLVQKFEFIGLNQGLHSVYWDGKNNQGVNVSSGTYLYKLETPNFQETKKMLLLK